MVIEIVPIFYLNMGPKLKFFSMGKCSRGRKVRITLQCFILLLLSKAS